MKQKFRFFYEVFRDTFTQWNDSNSMKNAANMAYYSVFSIPGLLIIIIWIAGYFFGQEAIRGEISHQISGALGSESAKSIEQMIAGAEVDKDGFLMKFIGVATLVFGATTLFFQLQKALNEQWNIEPAPKKALINFLLTRANSLGMILVIGFLMIVTMVLSSAISVLNGFITKYFGFETYQMMQAVNFSIGFLLTMLVFTVMFKVLPDIKISWNPVLWGAFVTTLLFTIGKFLLSYYFATFKPTSALGTVGTLALIMMWVNYSCSLVFLGAHFTKAYAYKKGYEVEPSRFAKWDKIKTLEEQLHHNEA